MKQSIAHIARIVRDYDEAIDFYTRKLHFSLVEDTYQPEQDKRWVVIAPPGSNGTTILLARASAPEQEPFIGKERRDRPVAKEDLEILVRADDILVNESVWNREDDRPVCTRRQPPVVVGRQLCINRNSAEKIQVTE